MWFLMAGTGSAESNDSYNVCFPTTEHLKMLDTHRKDMAITLTEILSQTYWRHQSRVGMSRPWLCFPIDAPRSMTNTVASLSAISMDVNRCLSCLSYFVLSNKKGTTTKSRVVTETILTRA